MTAIEFPLPLPARRPRAVAALAVTIASLMLASGVVITERVTNRDLREILADFVRPDAPASENVALGDRSVPPTQPPANSPTGTVGGTTSFGTAPDGMSPEASAGAGSSASGASRPGGAAAGRGAPPSASNPGAAANPAAGSGTAGAKGVVPGTAGAQLPGAIPAASGPDALAQTVRDLQPFVEREAGHAFTAPVATLVLSDAEFSSRLAQLNWLPKGAVAERMQGVYRSLGLIGPGVDLAAELAKFSRAQVTVLYDPVAGQLLVRSVDSTPYLRSMLVRELTRALDDQLFDIYRPTLDDPFDEARDGLKALAEGDAARLHGRYVAGLPAAERSQVEAERQRIAAQIPKDINRAVLARYGYAVNGGLNLVNALLSAGGRGRLDAAFGAPPTTSEHVLHPDRYLAGDGRQPVADPAADGPVEVGGTLGEVGLFSMLLEAMDADTAGRAAAGWGGDRYISWRQGSLTCTRATLVTDTDHDASELGAALERWVAARPGADVTGAGPYTIHRCG